MDKSFNGLRYSSALGCWFDGSGEKIRLCHGSVQIFLLLSQNLNKLVTREQLLSKVPSSNSESSNATNSDGSTSDDSLNDCIDQIRHVVGDDRLKAVPQVGYLLTSDTTTDTSVKLSGSQVSGSQVSGSQVSGSQVKGRPMPALVQDLVFNSQWAICAYQKHPHAWIGTFILIAVLLLSSSGTSINTSSGHLAYDRANATACSNRQLDCTSCLPSFWHTSPIFAHSNWFLSSGCL